MNTNEERIHAELKLARAELAFAERALKSQIDLVAQMQRRVDRLVMQLPERVRT